MADSTESTATTSEPVVDSIATLSGSATPTDGKLLDKQLRMLKGLRYRWERLQQSRSIDSDLLQSKRLEADRWYEDTQSQQKATHERDWQDGVTRWDSSLDKQITLAERETMVTLNHERQETQRLKSWYKQAKAAQKQDYEARGIDLKKRLDEGKAAAQKTRDSIRSKLDHEKIGIEEQMHACREWVGVRTGSTALLSLAATEAHPEAAKIASITDLPQVSKRFEDARKGLATSISRMQLHPTTRLLGSSWVLMFGPLLGILCGVAAWQLAYEPLIIVAVGVFSSILITATIYFATAPLVNRTIRRLMPIAVQNEQEAYLILMQGRRIADANCQNEFSKLEQQYSQSRDRLEAENESKLQKLANEFQKETEELVASCRTKRKTLAATRQQQFSLIDGSFEPKIQKLTETHANEKKQLDQDYQATLVKLDHEFHSGQRRSLSRWRSGCRTVSDRMRDVREKTERKLPPWNAMVNGNWPRSADSIAWPIGRIRPHVVVSELNSSSEDLPAIGNELSQGEPWPIMFDLLKHGSLILETDASSKEISDRIVQNTLARAVTSLPAGSVNVTIIDPEGLGKQFGWLMSLADIDPALVNHRVWTQPIHIADQLAQTARHVEDVIQQSLRNKYDNLMLYNRDAGPMAVPYRLILWSNFPFGLDDHSWQSLCAILSSGGRCGVGVILQVSKTHILPSFVDPAKLSEFGMRLRIGEGAIQSSDLTQRSGNSIASIDGSPLDATGNRSAANLVSFEQNPIQIDHPDLCHYPLEIDLPPAETDLPAIMEHQMEAAADIGKLIVPFTSIAPAPENVHQSTTADGLSIPLGISDASRVQSLRLGTGTAQHVLIAGKTGSGKSSLLHTMITSAALKYSPEQLRLVLLDFKKGVEFQVYSEVGLSHADIIGIESKREFGVSTLEYLDRVLHARGEAFRQWGVQDLPSLARKYPNEIMPRILIVIDEFQELFVEDDKLSQQASMLLDRIVRQGRSFGMHLVLASQTLGGAYSLPRTTLSQMAVRIALQCDSSDAMLILSEDNTAAERLRHSGQAIYNESGGRIESNQPFQVSYIEKSDQLRTMGNLPEFPVPHDPTTNVLGRRIVFEGHKPAVWEQRSIDLALQSQRGMEAGSVPIILGDSVSIDPPMIKTLSRSAGRNVMVVGGDEASVASILAGTIAGLEYTKASPAATISAVADASAAKLPGMIVLDGTRPEDTSLRSLISAMGSMQQSVAVYDHRAVDEAMQIVQAELARRSADPNGSYPTLFVSIVNLARFRELRRSEDFSFGDSGGAAKPDAILANLLTDGPALGIHCWIWADSAGTLGRWLSRQSLRDVEVRILMQMSASDSNQLIDSNVANRLDKYVALVHDDVEGKAIKFRPFELDSVLEKLAGKGS